MLFFKVIFSSKCVCVFNVVLVNEKLMKARMPSEGQASSRQDGVTWSRYNDICTTLSGHSLRIWRLQMDSYGDFAFACIVWCKMVLPRREWVIKKPKTKAQIPILFLFFWLPTLKMCHPALISSNMLTRYHSNMNWQMWGEAKNTFMMGTLVTLKLTHQIPASDKFKNINLPSWGNQNVMSLLENFSLPSICGIFTDVIAVNWAKWKTLHKQGSAVTQILINWQPMKFCSVVILS